MAKKAKGASKPRKTKAEKIAKVKEVVNKVAHVAEDVLKVLVFSGKKAEKILALFSLISAKGGIEQYGHHSANNGINEVVATYDRNTDTLSVEPKYKHILREANV